MTVELVVDSKSTLGEGPVWDDEKHVLYWVDILGKNISMYNPETEQIQKITLDQYVGSFALRRSGGFILALQHGFYFYNVDGEQLEKVDDPESHLMDNRFNDGKCDATGRFWAGTMSMMDDKNTGALYVVDKNLTVNKRIDNVSISNGLAWSPDNLFMYFIDTPTKKVIRYQYNVDSGKIAQPQVVVTFPDKVGYPDGMTIDEEGMLWIAHWGGGGISRWDPHKGKQLEFIHIPAVNVTSCTFGGKDLNQLYITTAQTGTSKTDLEKYPHAGGIFKIKTNVRGTISYKFDG